MARPQKEDGYTTIANEFLEALCKIRISGEAAQVLRVILRKTWGYNKKADMISGSQFMESTGLHRLAIHRARKKLLSMNLIAVSQKGNSQVLTYSIQKDYEKWKPLPKKRSVSQKGNGCIPKSIQTVSQKDAHKRQKKIDKRKENKRFNEIWDNYPNKDGKIDAERHFNSSVKTEKDWKDINRALRNYLSTDKVKKGYIKNGSTWFRNWRDWVDYKGPENIRNDVQKLEDSL